MSAAIAGSDESTFSRQAGSRAARRQAVNALATRVVYAGGWLILASVLAILLVILFEVLPLFSSPEVDLRESLSLTLQEGEKPLIAGIDEYLQAGYVITDRGSWIPVNLRDNPDGADLRPVSVFKSAEGASAFSPDRTGGVFRVSAGHFLYVDSVFSTLYEERRRVVPEVSSTELRTLAETSEDEGVTVVAQPHHIVAARAEGEEVVVSDIGGVELQLYYARLKKSLMGDVVRKEVRSSVPLPVDVRVSALLLSRNGQRLLVGTVRGELLHYKRPIATHVFTLNARETVSTARITSLGYLLGDQTIIVGDASGNVSSWQQLRNSKTGAIGLRQIYTFRQHSEEVVHFATSWRNKGFLTSGVGGEIFVHYGTTGLTQLSFTPAFLSKQEEIVSIRMTPKGNGIIATGSRGSYELWGLDNPHPEVSWKTLFGRVHYEGYQESEHVWQSTGATDDFEPKLSVIPLFVGTLKGTLYALIFAVPLAICGAFYASQFMHPTLRSYIKPVIELMAALPSVVIGFIAGLWLAPIIEPQLPAVLIFPIVCLATIALFCISLALLRKFFKVRSFSGVECLLLVPLIVLAAWLSVEVSNWLEVSYWSGDYRAWLYSKFGISVDQRNSVVAGIAVGFAVVPVIFTLAEDTLSSVPKHLVAGSLALGATLWQTAYRVVLPVAIPGIFSAIMIGLGRAVGETMIVLMATGNTPVLDWSIFNGFRALSANIAVELPEAPHNGTLYRVLFLTALLLFAMTFVLNTVSEVVRSHFRKKFKYL